MAWKHCRRGITMKLGILMNKIYEVSLQHDFAMSNHNHMTVEDYKWTWHCHMLNSCLNWVNWSHTLIPWVCFSSHHIVFIEVFTELCSSSNINYMINSSCFILFLTTILKRSIFSSHVSACSIKWSKDDTNNSQNFLIILHKKMATKGNCQVGIFQVRKEYL